MSSPTPCGFSRVVNNYPHALAKSVREATRSSVDTRVHITKMSDEQRRQMQERTITSSNPATPVPALNTQNSFEFGYRSLSDIAEVLNPGNFDASSTPLRRASWLAHNHPALAARAVYQLGVAELCVPSQVYELYLNKLRLDAESKVERSPRVNSKAKRLLKDEDVCSYCNRRGTPEKDPDNKTWHMDHVEPFYCNRYLDVLHNIVKCCAHCSRKKGKKTLAEVGMKLLPSARFAAPNKMYHDLLMSLSANNPKWSRVVSEIQTYAPHPRLENLPSRALASSVPVA